jgi:hypothetical protein
MKVFKRLGVRWLAWMAVVAVLELHPHAAQASEARRDFCSFSEAEFTTDACGQSASQCDLCCELYDSPSPGGLCIGSECRCY